MSAVKNNLSGRLNYDNNLIVDVAPDVEQLERQMKALLFEFEDLEPETVEFDLYYDVYALFVEFDFINITKFAKYAGINAALMRQYASGVKNPAIKQARKIEDALHRFSREIEKITIFAH